MRSIGRSLRWQLTHPASDLALERLFLDGDEEERYSADDLEEEDEEAGFDRSSERARV